MSGNGLDGLGVGGPPAVGAAAADRPDLIGGFANDYSLIRREPTRLAGNRRPDSLDPAPFLATPQYREGAENGLAYLSPEALASLQQQMAQAGLIGPRTKVTVGVADDATVSAYKDLLSLANRYAVSDTEALQMLRNRNTATGSTAGGGAGGTGGPTTTKRISTTEPVFTDPATARATLKTTWEEMFGRAPTEREYERYAAKLKRVEGGNNRTVTTTTYNPATGVTTDSTERQDDTTDASPAVIADQMASTGRLAKEAGTRKAGVDYYGAIAQLIGGQ